jgi:hypothetical protein
VKRFSFFVLVGSSALIISTQAYAQATRTWVSGVGDDANPCSRTAPCKTFAGAISKTTASGEIDILDPGGFGQLTITKAITIDGGPNAGGIVAASGNGITIAAGIADIVTIRNLRLYCVGTCLSGVQINSAKAVHLQNIDISGFTNHGVNLTSATTLYVDLTTVRESGLNGINLAPTATSFASITNSRFEANTNGVVVNDFAKATVSNSHASGNSGAGFLAQSNAAPATLNLINCDAAFNTVAGVHALSAGSAIATVRLSASSFTSNGEAIVTTGVGTVLSFQNNPITGIGIPTGTLSLQ